MAAYYNEIDPKAAAWLRELIKEGHIAPGDVDERSIEDVRPDDLRDYKQCHFFAGIGVWSRALRDAGWDDNRPAWTGSCPCQPFSSAGEGAGFADPRHLWPAWFKLIKECRPRIIFGEQVASKLAIGGVSRKKIEASVEPAWIDLVFNDLERASYTTGAVAFPACSVGAPHIRLRTYFTAVDDAIGQGLEGYGRDGRPSGLGNLESGGCGEQRNALVERGSGHADGAVEYGGLGDSESERRIGRQDDRDGGRRECPSGQAGQDDWVGQSECIGSGRNAGASSSEEGGSSLRPVGTGSSGSVSGPGPTNGHWRDVDWLFCRDNKWRPVESGTFPLVNGTPARVGRLRGYGNAIVLPQAKAFIQVMMEYLRTDQPEAVSVFEDLSK